MIIVPHPDNSKPRLKVVRIEEEDNIAPRDLIAHAFRHGAVDGQLGPHQMIWVQYGGHQPVSYYVNYLRRCDVHGAMIDLERGLYLPEEEEVR